MEASEAKFLKSRSKYLTSFASSDLERTISIAKDSRRKRARQRLGRQTDNGELEALPRKWSKVEDDGKNGVRLPIKTVKGKWVERPVEAKKDTNKMSEESVLNAGKELPRPCETGPAKTEDELKNDLALLALAITEDPENNLSGLRELRSLLRSISKTPVDYQRVLLLSALAVYKDIIPGYRIRGLTEEEKKVKVSKDIKKIRQYEETLLSCYEEYVRYLHDLLSRLKKEVPKELRTTAIKCLCELLQSASHFNFFDLIAEWVVTQAVIPDAVDREACCKALESMFNADIFGMNSMIACRILSDAIKSRRYKVDSTVIKVFMSIRCFDETPRMVDTKSVNPLPPTNQKKHLSKTAKKELKLKRAELAKIAEAETTVTREERRKWQSETLKYLFRIYFGILKDQPGSPLLPEVLEGLARFSRMLNVELLTDLLFTLRKLTSSRDLDIMGALQLILTVFRIASIHETSQAMDMHHFYCYFYKQLGRLTLLRTDHMNAIKWKLVEQCFEQLFLKTRQIPSERVAAFAHRIGTLLAGDASTFSLSLTVLLGILRRLLETYPRARAILEAEPFGQGVYRPDLDDPDLCNPFSERLLVVDALCKHTDVKIADQARAIVKMTPHI